MRAEHHLITGVRGTPIGQELLNDLHFPLHCRFQECLLFHRASLEGRNPVMMGCPAVTRGPRGLPPPPANTGVLSKILTISSGSGGGSWEAASASRFFCLRFFLSSMRFWIPPTSMISRRRSRDVLRTRSWPCIEVACQTPCWGLGAPELSWGRRIGRTSQERQNPGLALLPRTRRSR